MALLTPLELMAFTHGSLILASTSRPISYNGRIEKIIVLQVKLIIAGIFNFLETNELSAELVYRFLN